MYTVPLDPLNLDCLGPAPLLQPPSPSSPSSPLAMPAGSGFSNGILGSPRSRRSSHAAKSSGDVASVYVTINPDVSGCSALLLLIGTRLFQQPPLFLSQFESTYEHILLPFTLTAE